MGDGDRGGGAVGCEDDIFRKLSHVEVVNRRGTRRAREKDVDDLLAVEDPARGAKLSVFVGEERDEGFAISLAVGVQETLFE